MGEGRPRRRSATAAAVALSVALVASACLPAPPADPPGRVEGEPPPAQPAPVREAEALPTARVDDVPRLAREATARVRSVGCGRLTTGSGVRVGDDLVLTNRHVVDRATDVTINTWDGDGGRATTVTVDARADVALLQVDDPPERAVELAPTDPAPGDELLLIGHPGGGRQVLATGPALEYLGPDQLPDLDPAGAVLRIGALVSPGSSGGPVLDEAGRLAALVFAYEAGAGHALAIPASRLAPLLEAGPTQLHEPAGC